MDLSNWLNTPRVSIDFRADYGKELLKATGERKPEFRLMPKYLMNGYDEETVVAFSLTFEDGRMLPNWEELQFTPRGTEPVPALSRKLPYWSPKEEELYADVLDPLVTQLYAAQTRLERLEAKLPLFMNRCAESRRRLTLDRVRMVYLENAVEWQEKSAPPKDFTPNLALIVISYADGYKVMQNGVGTGPPREAGP
jgi:hypothetical protein